MTCYHLTNEVPDLKYLAEQSHFIKTHNSDVRRNKNQLPNFLKLDEIDNNEKKIDEPISLRMNESLFPEMKYEVNRLKSFEKDWPHTFIKPEECASVGLFFLGKDHNSMIFDRVQCAFCNGIISNWEEGDKPIAEHIKYFPMCPFLLHQDVGNIPLTNGLKKYQLYNSWPERSATNSLIRYRFPAPSSNLSAKYPDMTCFDKRLNTFKEKNAESLFVHVSPQSLAEAGLFYTGVSDVVSCFSCGGQLANWSHGDNAWVEHARHFPLCSFVKFIKGSSFIQNAKSSQNIQNASTSGACNAETNEVCESSTRKLNKGLHEAVNAINLQENKNLESASTSAQSEQNDENKFLCKICMDSVTRVAFIPCGHSLACPACAKELKTCPLCRKTIQSSVRLYFD